MVSSNYSVPGNGAAKNFGQVNNEIKSHSSVLFNERLHVLLYIIETEGVEVHSNPKLKPIIKLKSALYSLWKIVRTLVYNDPVCRNVLKLETQTPGLYTPDVGFIEMDEKINFLLQNNQYVTYENMKRVIWELDQTEQILRNILQFYKYFIRFDKPQKPDIDVASERYKAMIDERTKDELQEVLGKRAKISLNDLDTEIDDSYFEDLKDDN